MVHQTLDASSVIGEGIGLYNPLHARFYIRDVLAAGSADNIFDFGASDGGLLPLAGDWNADGSDSVGLYNPLI